MFRSGETLGLFTGNKGGHNEHFLKFSALYYFFPFQNLKFLDYTSNAETHADKIEHFNTYYASIMLTLRDCCATLCK